MTLPKKPKILVIQPRPGIGDMIWHLPYTRALARRAASGSVTVLTKSNANARSWLSHEPSIDHFIYLDRRLMPLMGLKLRKEKFDEAWVFHESFSYALVPFLAGIPRRFGPGLARDQRLLLTNRPLPDETRELRHIEQMNEMMSRENYDIRTDDQRLILEKEALKYCDDHFLCYPTPWVTYGVGASDETKTWPLTYFQVLSKGLAARGAKTFFICGSKSEKDKVMQVTNSLRSMGLGAVPVYDLSLPRVFALLSKASLFIGNDSSLLNASACLGIPSLGLFGATAPLTYSPYMHQILPPEGIFGKEGMQAISPEQVLSYVDQKDLLASKVMKKEGTNF